MDRFWKWLPVLLLIPCLAVAGVIWRTVSYSKGADGRASWVYAADVTADNAGIATGSIALQGHVNRATTAWIGTNPPLPAYDCTLNDADGVDVMGGALVDRINTTGQGATPSAYITTAGSTHYPYAPRVDGTVTLSCSGMGTTSQATVKLYVTQ